LSQHTVFVKKIKQGKKISFLENIYEKILDRIYLMCKIVLCSEGDTASP
jgi:hypothetical protein